MKSIVSLRRARLLVVLSLLGACGGDEFIAGEASGGAGAGAGAGQAGAAGQASPGGAGQSQAGAGQGGSVQAGAGGEGGSQAGAGGEPGGAGQGGSVQAGAGGNVAGASGAGAAGAGGGQAGAGGGASCQPGPAQCNADATAVVTCDGGVQAIAACSGVTPRCFGAACVACLDAADCPAPAADGCTKSYTCDNHECKPVFKTNGFKLKDPTPQDCHSLLCEDGNPSVEIDANDPPPPKECFEVFCSATGAPASKPAPGPCGGGYCTATSACCACPAGAPTKAVDVFLPGCLWAGADVSTKVFTIAGLPSNASPSGNKSALVDGDLSSGWNAGDFGADIEIAAKNNPRPYAVELLMDGTADKGKNWAILVDVIADGVNLTTAHFASPNVTSPASRPRFRVPVPAGNGAPIAKLTLSIHPDFNAIATSTDTGATAVSVYEISQEVCP